MLKMESKFLRHESCPKCGSKNNLARYSDGHAHCFTDGCDYYEKADGQVRQITKKISGLLDGEIKANLGNNIHGNLLEALVGAIFIDRGYKKCKE